MALAHAILAALIEQPCSGYDLAKRFDGSVGFFWKASHQQIYRELTKLEDQSWLSSESIRQEGRPDKKLYYVTELGKNALRDWIAQPAELRSIKDELLVKLFAGYLVPKEKMLAELEQHRSQHLERLTEYQKIEQQYFQNPQTLPIERKYQYLTLRSGLRYETDWLAWCEEVMQFIG
jgi:DNA-binding PadR family transcriptional regulator